VAAFERQGTEVYLDILDYGMYESSKDALLEDTRQLIERTMQVIPKGLPVITIGTPPEFHPQLGSLKIGVGLFEAFGLPPPWIVQLNTMDMILTLSEFNKEVFIRHGISRDKIVVIPPAISCARFRPDVSPFYVGVVRPFVILFVGQLILRKGWDKLLIAALRTFRRYDDVCVILKLPPARSRGLREAAVEKIREVKKVAGGSKVKVYYNDYPIPVEQIPRVYQIVSKRLPKRIYRFLNGDPPKGIFALPSLGEGIGLPYLEAQASGILTLGTMSTGQEFLNPSNAVIVETGTPKRDLRVELETTLYRGAPFPSVTIEAVSDALRIAYEMSDNDRVEIVATARAQAEELTYDKCAEAILRAIEARV
jgi:glycosyltransferase involved in cell wall biosynthesis